MGLQEATNPLYDITEDPFSPGSFSNISGAGRAFEYYAVENDITEHPGLIGFQLQDRPDTDTLFCYLADTDFNEEYPENQLTVITSGTPNITQIRVNAVTGWCAVHSGHIGAVIAAIYDSRGSNISLANINRMVDDRALDQIEEQVAIQVALQSIPSSLLTTKGDLVGRSSSVPVRIPIGNDFEVPFADSDASSGISYRQPFARNYVRNQSAKVDTSNITGHANITVSRTTSASEVPTGGTGIKLSASSSVAIGDTVTITCRALDLVDRSGDLEVSFDFVALAGYDASDAQIVIYDGSSEITLPGNFNKIPATTGRLRRFFASSSSTGVYEIRIKSLVASSAWAFAICNVHLGSTIGTMSTEWVNMGVVTIGARTTAPTKGTTSIDEYFVMRSGCDLLGRYNFSMSTAGTAGSGVYQYALIPSGLAIDTNKLSTVINDIARNSVGSIAFDTPGVNGHIGNFEVESSTQLRATCIRSGDAALSQVGSAFCPLNNGGAGFTSYHTSGQYRVPISGWR